MATAVAVGVAGATLSEAQQTEEEYVATVLLGTTFGILFHELGHALIGEMQLPSTGPEEDVADEFAAWAMADFDPQGGEVDAFVESIVRYSSLLWYYNAREGEQSGRASRHPWQSEHAPDIRRFRHSFCMLYGKAPSRFEDLANAVNFGLPAKQRCINDYAKRDHAWKTLLRPHMRNIEPDLPGDHAANAPGGQVFLRFDPSHLVAGQVVKAMFRDTGMAEGLRSILQRQFVWPRDLHIVFRDCGEANAYYVPTEGMILMCYDLIQQVSNTVIGFERGQVTDGMADGAAFLVGNWVAKVPSQDGLLTLVAVYKADFTYQIDTHTRSSLVEQVAGKWRVDSGEGRLLTLRREPTDWMPREYVDQYGYVRPIELAAEAKILRVIDAQTVDINGTIWRRR